MKIKRLMLTIILLEAILGCAATLQNVKISGNVIATNPEIEDIKIICFVQNADNKRIDTKSMTVTRGEGYMFEVPENSQVVLDAASFINNNRIFRATSQKIKIGEENIASIDLVLRPEEVEMQEYKGRTVNISGKIINPNYRGPLDITVVTQENLNKVKNTSSWPITSAKKTINNTNGTVDLNIDVPANLGPSLVCVFCRNTLSPPVCKEIDIGNSDIKDFRIKTIAVESVDYETGKVTYKK